MKNEFFGSDLEEAKSLASTTLGISPDELDYFEVDPSLLKETKEPKVVIVVEFAETLPPPKPEYPLIELEKQLDELGDDVVGRATLILENILGQMGWEVEVSASKNEEDVILVVKFLDTQTDLRRGDMRELRGSIQYLINRIANVRREADKRFIVDFGGKSKERGQGLAKLSSSLSSKVLELGKQVKILLMDSQDRRLLHLALIKDSKVSTFSEGEGRFRYMCVGPKKKK